MIVREVMKTNVVCVTSETKATDAKALMTENKVTRLPVVDNGKLVGLVTKSDLNKAEPSAATTLDMFEISSLLAKLTVKKVMSKKVITVSPDEVVEEAARIMVDNNVSCLPVIKDGALVGIITENNLFSLFIEMFGARTKGVRAVVYVDDKPGQLAKVTKEISDAKANIISAVTTKHDAENKTCITLKATGIKEAQLKQILENCGYVIQDIRVI